MTKKLDKYHLTILLIIILSSYFQHACGMDPTQIEIHNLKQLINARQQTESDSLSVYYYNLGHLYASQMKYDSAYKYYELSLNIAHKTSNKYQLAVISNTIGSYYYGCENYDEAFEHYTRSYALYTELNSQKGIASLANNLGEIERLRGVYDTALIFYFSALPINEKLHQYGNLSINHNNIGLTYAQLGKYDSSIYHLKIAKEIAIQHELKNNLNIILNSLGTYFMLINEYDSSYYYLSVAYAQSLDLKHVHQIKENSSALSLLFDKMGQTDSAYFYHKIFKIHNDSILNNKNLMRVGLLVIRNKLENERRIERIEQSRKELYYVVFIITTLLVLVILILLWVNQKNKTRHSQLQMEHLSLEKKYLNNELTNFALHISEHNHLLEEIKKSLKQLDLNQINESALKELKLKLNTGLSNTQDNKILEQKVDEHNRDFIQQLKSLYPTLTKSELKLCSLLKLNLPTKDIAAINKVSPQAIKVARYRLRKKLKVASETSLGDFLNDLYKD